MAKAKTPNPERSTGSRTEIPRHRAIYEALLGEIRSGVYKPGDRLPSESVLCERFGASRITVAKAFQGLQRDQLVTRRPGSGSYVERPQQDGARQFGLLIPELGSTDIFEPICKGIVRSPAARNHSLAWGHAAGHTESTAEAAEELARQYIAQGVAGVFFAPMEFKDGNFEVNRGLAEQMQRAGLSVVLLDRDFMPFPERSTFDLVGTDNHLAGYTVTRHLIESGARRLLFVTRPLAAATVQARIAGFRESIIRFNTDATGTVLNCDIENLSAVADAVLEQKIDSVVCANDITATKVMHALLERNIRIPEQVMIAGVDDVPYAQFLPISLTTYRQDCAGIGAAAMELMLDRIAEPEMPARDVRITGELMIRQSSRR